MTCCAVAVWLELNRAVIQPSNAIRYTAFLIIDNRFLIDHYAYMRCPSRFYNSSIERCKRRCVLGSESRILSIYKTDLTNYLTRFSMKSVNRIGQLLKHTIKNVDPGEYTLSGVSESRELL